MKHNDEQLYTITLTRKQMLQFTNCVEGCVRFLAKECEHDFTTSGLNNQREIQEKLRELHDLVATNLPGQPYLSYRWTGGSCPNEHQRKKIAQLYTLYREIRHCIAVVESLDNVYAGSTPICEEQDPFIKIEKVL